MRRSIARALPLLLVAVAACRNGNDGLATTLQTLWPNKDGASWTYQYVADVWDTPVPAPPIYPTIAELPPVPTIAEVAALLGTQPAGNPVRTDKGVYTLAFDGNVTTSSGVTAQHLVRTLEPVTPAGRAGGPDRGQSALLAQLWIARPDLRAKLAAIGVPEPRAEGARSDLTFFPLFLSGYAWARTEDWIGGYGDVDRNPSWRYLQANLDPGSEFTLPIFPFITNDVFLHGRILPRENVDTPAGVFQNAVVCLYVVDYGPIKVTDNSGVLLGYAQMFTYGTVAYAPTIGPVASYERDFVTTGTPLSSGAGQIRLALTGRHVPRP